MNRTAAKWSVAVADQVAACPSSFRFRAGLGNSPGFTNLPPIPDDGEPAWLLELNDVRVHTPVNLTALVIPPESRIRRGTVVDRLYGSSRHQRKIGNGKTPLRSQDRDQAGLPRVQLHG